MAKKGEENNKMNSQKKEDKAAEDKEELQMTPQMMTLGRSGSDLDEDAGARHPQAAAAAARKKGGWFSRWTATGVVQAEEEQEDDENYHEMNDDSVRNRSLSFSPRRQVHPSSLVVSSSTEPSAAAYTSLESIAAAPAAAISPPTQEDVLKQDCGFFFRGSADDHDESHRSRRRRHRSSLREIRRTNRNSDLFEYSNAVDCISPVVLQQYRTKYLLLNSADYAPARQRSRHAEEHEIMEHNDDGIMLEGDHHDLQLLEGGGDDDDDGYTESSQLHQHIVRTDTITSSCLFYKKDGRLIMRLPRDQVRLLMDPDLEPGILSVEQCRRPSDDDEADDSTLNKNGTSTTTTASTYYHDHPLRYVLTVDENLYRQIVSEMSPQQTRCCGLWGVFRHDRVHGEHQERVDIRVACALLTIVLLVLFINTVAVHED